MSNLRLILGVFLLSSLLAFVMADCTDTLDNVEPKLRRLLGDFWLDFDSYTVNVQEKTAAEKNATAIALVNTYFTDNVIFQMYFGPNHPSNVSLVGARNLSNWMVQSATTLSGGESHTFGFPRFSCSDISHYTMIVPSHSVARAKFLYPTMDTYLVSTIRMDFVRRLLGGFKISLLYTEGQEGWAATITGNPKWNPVTNI